MRQILYALPLLWLISCGQRPPNDLASPTDGAPPMEYVEVCDHKAVCRNFSRLVMGTDHLVQANWSHQDQAEISDEELFEILDEAAKNGINFFDTSPIYVGGVENKLGKWLESRKERIKADEFYYDSALNPDRKIYILSKGGFPFDLLWMQKLPAGTHSAAFKEALQDAQILQDDTANEDGTIDLEEVPAGTYASRLFGSEAQIKERVAEELGHTRNNLNEQITVYLMHRDDADFLGFEEIVREQTPVATIMKVLSDDSLAAHYDYIGWSNWREPRVNESVSGKQELSGFIKPAFNSPYFSLFEMSQRSIHAGGIQVTHEEMQRASYQEGIHIMPYSPLGGFSILDKPEPKWQRAKEDAKAKFEAGDDYWRNVYPAIFTAANEARFERTRSFVADFNERHSTSYSLDQLINAYALRHKRTDLLAVGPITKAQIRRTVWSLALAKKLSEGDLDYLHSGK